MKRLIALSALGLLLSACKPEAASREHVIVCYDSVSQQETYNIVVPGNVIALVAKGHPVLGYRNSEGKAQIIFLNNNDCGIY